MMPCDSTLKQIKVKGDTLNVTKMTLNEKNHKLQMLHKEFYLQTHIIRYIQITKQMANYLYISLVGLL